MKKTRQKNILSIIGAKRIATQTELAEELARRGIEATQSSVSRDIYELGLTKVNGHSAAPRAGVALVVPTVKIDTAGDNIIVVKTDTGQAQPAALVIDRADLEEVIGTVAGDDTILVAVKNASAQRAAIKKLKRMFERAARSGRMPLENSRGEKWPAGYETGRQW
jgi:transcriptional regulator of arginine metabolism